MRYRHRTTVVTALGLVLLTDVLRVFLPSVITIFGQAASTPAELLGAFALGWFVLALAVPPLLRRVGARPVALVAAVVLAGARLAVTGFPGGRAQLWLATAGLVAGLCWLTAVAAGSNRPVPGLALGLAAAAVLHTVSDTYRSPWLGGAEVWVVGVVLAALFLAGQALPAPPAGAGGARAWLLVGPALLLAGMVALSPAVARTAMSYQFGLLGSSPAQGSGAAVAPLFDRGAGARRHRRPRCRRAPRGGGHPPATAARAGAGGPGPRGGLVRPRVRRRPPPGGGRRPEH
ncbi:hypothetical protein AB0I37_08100 [Micromonospora purpureochromogenes]|uniref:hypothetical protein n=1 Tax=Micromonospora purpureochromogenes TaxID=47872 RepID=UPI0033BFCA4C